MALILKTATVSGLALVVTARQRSDSQWWDDTAGQFQASTPTFVDKSISLTEGTGDYAGSYSGSPSQSMGTVDVDLYFHDTANSNVVIATTFVELVNGEEVSQAAIADTIVAKINAGDTFVPNPQHVWNLERTSTGVAPKDEFIVTKEPGEVLRVYANFSALLGKGEEISSIISVVVASGTVTEVTAVRGIVGRYIELELIAGVKDETVTDVTITVVTTRNQTLLSDAMQLQVK